MTYLAWFTLIIAIIHFLVSLVNLLAFHYLPDGSPEEKPYISILIPARNEEKKIGNLLPDLLQIPYREMEILIYNDESTDGTQKIIEEYRERDNRIQLLQGQRLPDGWTGKNNACHQLALKAEGEYYLFLDADVRVEQNLIDKSLYWMEKHHLALLSIFPVQKMHSFGEKISVPLMNWILLTFLPMPLIRRNHMPPLAAANGQFMLFPSKVYDAFMPHRVFKEHWIEDVAIIRFFKKNRLRVDTMLGKNDIYCRMYGSLGNAIEGFTKSIFLFFGDSKLITVLYALVITLAPPLIIISLPAYTWFIYIFLVIMIRVQVSLASRQPVIQNLILLLPQQVVFLLIICRALYNDLTGTLIWKGRRLQNT